MRTNLVLLLFAVCHWTPIKIKASDLTTRKRKIGYYRRDVSVAVDVVTWWWWWCGTCWLVSTQLHLRPVLHLRSGQSEVSHSSAVQWRFTVTCFFIFWGRACVPAAKWVVVLPQCVSESGRPWQTISGTICFPAIVSKQFRVRMLTRRSIFTKVHEMQGTDPVKAWRPPGVVPATPPLPQSSPGLLSLPGEGDPAFDICHVRIFLDALPTIWLAVNNWTHIISHREYKTKLRQELRFEARTVLNQPGHGQAKTSWSWFLHRWSRITPPESCWAFYRQLLYVNYYYQGKREKKNNKQETGNIIYITNFLYWLISRITTT